MDEVWSAGLAEDFLFEVGDAVLKPDVIHAANVRLDGIDLRFY
jgi:hypothetical protein